MGAPLGALSDQLASSSRCTSVSLSVKYRFCGVISSLMPPSKIKSIPGAISASPITISGIENNGEEIIKVVIAAAIHVFLFI